MRMSRNVAGTVFVGAGLALTLGALAYPAMLGVQNTSSASSRVIANTRYGPLTEADRDFVVKVRAAGLWEFPAGEMALKKGTTAATRTAGAHLVTGHAALDATCRKIAPLLGITLPNEASPQQRGFVATLSSDSGNQFDSDLANILRVTHGQIFSVVAKIRVTTKNTMVRALADQANTTVLDHITVLEKTGLVNFDSVLFQESTPPKLPADQVTPPPPQPGAPVLALNPPADLSTTSPTPSPSPTTG